MTPAARWQAAADLLDGWRPGAPMDRALTAWGRRSRYAGSGDRAAVADLVYAVLRRWRSLGWGAPAGTAPGRARVLALAAERGAAVLFDGARHAPAPPDAAEAAWLAARDLSDAPQGVRWDLPDWLVPLWAESLGAGAEAAARLSGERAPLDLRVNRLKADTAEALAALAEDGVAAEALAAPAGALRVTEGARRLRLARAYLEGLVEVQDAASQAVADFAGARPGDRVLDYCAGGGGKALALAAALGPGARVHAHDADPARMADLPARAARAGAAVDLGPPEGRFDLVLADAPCSGSGAWRRNPDAKWALTPEALDRLRALQARVLAQAAAFVAPGGRLVYATCSVLRVENEDVATRTPGWRVVRQSRLVPGAPGDGFFAAELRAEAP